MLLVSQEKCCLVKLYIRNDPKFKQLNEETVYVPLGTVASDCVGATITYFTYN